jgi:hypothetical protein
MVVTLKTGLGSSKKPFTSATDALFYVSRVASQTKLASLQTLQTDAA